MKVVLGIDPGLSTTGVTLLSEKKISIQGIELDPFKKRMDLLIERVELVSSTIRIMLDEFGSEDVRVVIELPAPRGVLSGGLYMAVYAIAREFKEYPVGFISPLHIASVHGTRKYGKKDTINLVKSKTAYFSNKGVIVITKGPLNDHMADSFCIGMRLHTEGMVGHENYQKSQIQWAWR